MSGADLEPQIIELMYVDESENVRHCRARVIEARNRIAELVQNLEMEEYDHGDWVCYQPHPDYIFPVITARLPRPADDGMPSVISFPHHS
jgi:hypothetical protein